MSSHAPFVWFKYAPLQEQTVLTLWAIAGNDLNEQMNVSAQIGVSLLVDFLKTRQNFEKLNYIGKDLYIVLDIYLDIALDIALDIN